MGLLYLLETVFEAGTSTFWKQKFSKCSPWVSTQALQERERERERETSGTLLSSTMSNWGAVYRDFLLNVFSVLLQGVSLQTGSVTFPAWRSNTTFCTCSTEILEHRVSGAVGGTRRTNSKACSFPCLESVTVLGAFGEIAKIHHPSVVSHGTSGLTQDGFSWNLIISKLFVQKIQVSLQSANNNRYFTWRPIYIFDHISLSSS